MRRDRLFVRGGRRHFRRRYSVREAQSGLAMLGVLGVVAAWVIWRGAHPDPELFELTMETTGEMVASRGPLPEKIAPAGWKETKLASFGPDDLYVKVNGRADFYLSFGFQRLVVATLADESDPSRFVDVELFDQGTGANALGAYDGERAVGQKSTADAGGGLHHFDRNALFVARDRYYIRAIGSDQTEATQEALAALHATLTDEIAAGWRPWGQILFVDNLGLSVGQVSFVPEGAFSFGFARNVYVARLDEDLELFIAASPAPGSTADALAERFVEGFRSYGEELDGGWVRDRYIQTIAAADAVGPWVVGLKGAPDVSTAAEQLRRLRAGASALGEDVLERAREESSPADDVEGGEPPPEESSGDVGGTEEDADYGGSDEL